MLRHEGKRENSAPNIRHEMHKISMLTIPGIPIIQPGDDVASILLKTLPQLKEGDIVIIAQKIISKAENRFVRLSEVQVSEEARQLSSATGRDARYCQVVLNESKRVIETKGKVIVVEHRTGTICTSAGIDKSNLQEENILLLLPENSDLSADRIRRGLEEATGKQIAVIINDSGGSPYRQGAIGEAIGFSGIRALQRTKKSDLYGRECTPAINVVDQLSAMASLMMGEAGEGTPVVLVRGYPFERDLKACLKDILIPEMISK